MSKGRCKYMLAAAFLESNDTGNGIIDVFPC